VPEKLLLIGHHHGNLEIAKKVGADITINSTTYNEVEGIMKFTGGEGCEVVFETVGEDPKLWKQPSK